MAEESRRPEEEHRLVALEIEKREVRRKLAEAEFEVWSESSSTHTGRSIKTSFSKLPHQRAEVTSTKVTSRADKVQDKRSMVTSHTHTHTHIRCWPKDLWSQMTQSLFTTFQNL